jgi:hypothetical protein
VGYVIWFKSPFYTIAENNLDIPDGDPTESVLADALTIVAGPLASTPEFPWPAAAVALTAVAGGGVVIAMRRRAGADSSP